MRPPVATTPRAALRTSSGRRRRAPVAAARTLYSALPRARSAAIWPTSVSVMVQRVRLPATAVAGSASDHATTGAGSFDLLLVNGLAQQGEVILHVGLAAREAHHVGKDDEKEQGIGSGQVRQGAIGLEKVDVTKVHAYYLRVMRGVVSRPSWSLPAPRRPRCGVARAPCGARPAPTGQAA